MAIESISRDNLTLKEKILSISWPFIGLIVVVACIGIAAQYSAAGGTMDSWAGQQAVRFAAGLCGLFVVALIDIRFWHRVAYLFYAVSLALLVYVEIKGHIGMGAQRWINLGFMHLQPSEVMKIATVLALSRIFHGITQDDVSNPVRLIVPAAFVVAPVALVALQPDLGTALMITFASIVMFFIAGVSYWYFAAGGIAALAAMPVAWALMHDYQKRRVMTFLNPESDPLGAGYHITQSKIALGSGGFSGKGYLQGTQSKLNFLPEKQTDFIFTLFAEEWGFVGGAVLMGLFATVILYGAVIAMHCHNQFSRLLAFGIVVNFSIYVFINIGMVMGLLPVVGIPLPMISYGGSSMLAVLFGFGLLMSAHVHRRVKFSRRGGDLF